MADDRTDDISVLDRNVKPELPGTTLIRFVLSAEPDEDWIKSFHAAIPPPKSGSFNFVHSNPELRGDVISWSVPTGDETTAVAYVEQSIIKANQASVLRPIPQPEADDAEQMRLRREADTAGVADRTADEARLAQARKDADGAGAKDRLSQS